jgi:hypothetical protein
MHVIGILKQYYASFFKCMSKAAVLPELIPRYSSSHIAILILSIGGTQLIKPLALFPVPAFTTDMQLYN